jgi:type I restriction-modification system DNA methylase subunit
MPKITSDVLTVLDNCEMHGNELRITEQLDKTMYMAVNRVLEAAGGKWNRKAKAHLFDGEAAEVIEPIVLTGEYSRTKQDFGAFFTPPSLAAQVAKRITFTHTGMRLLEPSAGMGALALAARDEAQADDERCSWADITCLEIQPKLVVALREQHLHAECADFLDEDPVEYEPFGAVLMNPPFAKQADIHHVMHATRFLKPGGCLVAITSASVLFRQNNLTERFREFVSGCGTIERLPEYSFKESGTSVNTALVVLTRRG